MRAGDSLFSKLILKRTCYTLGTKAKRPKRPKQATHCKKAHYEGKLHTVVTRFGAKIP